MAGEHRLAEGTAPSTPSSGYVSIYAKSDHRLYAKDSLGNETCLGRFGLSENFLYNGGFDFAQRQVPGTLTTYSTLTTTRKYAADRWGINGENDSVQYARTDTNTAPETGLTARYYGRLVKITNAGKVTMVQIVEGVNVMPLRGRRVRLSFKLKRATGTAITMRMGLLALGSGGTIDTIPSTLYTDLTTATGTDPTLGANVTQLTPQVAETGTIVGNGLDCVLTTAWQRFSATFDVPSTCKNLIAAIWSNADLAINDEVDVSEAQLTDGADVTDWTPRPYGQEFMLCQRYYSKTFNVDQNPTTNVGANTGEYKWQSTTGAAAVFAGQGYRFPVSMRVAPTTLTIYNPSAANNQIRNVTDGADCSGSTVTACGEQSCWLNATGSAGEAAGEHMSCHLSADAEM